MDTASSPSPTIRSNAPARLVLRPHLAIRRHARDEGSLSERAQRRAHDRAELLNEIVKRDAPYNVD
jgi:hypothetical protein